MTEWDKTTADMSNLKVEDNADRKILIAVDFGTTFSGVAWAQTRRVGITMAQLKPNAASDHSR